MKAPIDTGGRGAARRAAPRDRGGARHRVPPHCRIFPDPAIADAVPRGEGDRRARGLRRGAASSISGARGEGPMAEPALAAGSGTGVAVPAGETFADIREGVRALCAGFPGEYWCRLDRERAYPAAFVRALTEAGYLACADPRTLWRQRPAARRRRRDPGGNPPRRLQRRRPATRRCTPWARCCGTAPTTRRHAGCRASPPARCGSRPSPSPNPPPGRTPRGCGPGRCATATATASAARRCGPARAEHSDLMLLLARTAPVEEGGAAPPRPVGVPRRYPRRARRCALDPPDPHHDKPRHHGDLLRQSLRARRRADRRGG